MPGDRWEPVFPLANQPSRRQLCVEELCGISMALAGTTIQAWIPQRTTTSYRTDALLLACCRVLKIIRSPDYVERGLMSALSQLAREIGNHALAKSSSIMRVAGFDTH